LRSAPDVSVRVATETVGGRKIARKLHRFRTPSCTPTVRLNLDLALSIDATVTRRLASKAQKVRHGISHGSFVRNILHE
jgi:hypothetical protein